VIISKCQTFMTSSREWAMQRAGATVIVAFAASMWVAGQRMSLRSSGLRLLKP
jgi:hypothetical protein